MNTTSDQQNLVVTTFTDPVCTWCWGSEPIFRKLETHYPGRIVIRPVMGGLVKDARNLSDPANGIGSTDLETFNRQVGAHWVEASERHGMPVDGPNFHLFSNAYPSTYPQNIAYEAAKLTDPQRADLFLYNVRAASAAEARLTNREDVLLTIADESGIDVGAFIGHLEDGSAEKAFRDDLALCQHVGASGFPTFLVRYGTSQIVLNGYRTYETFASLASRLSNKELVETEVNATPDALLSYMDNHPRMAAEEVRQAFDLGTIEAVDELVNPLIDAGLLERQYAGNGWFVRLPSQGGACNLTTGTCL